MRGLLCGVTLGHSLTPDCRDTFLFRGVALTLGETILLRSGTLAATTKGEGHGEWSREQRRGRVETHHSLPHLHSTGTALEEEKPW